MVLSYFDFTQKMYSDQLPKIGQPLYMSYFCLVTHWEMETQTISYGGFNITPFELKLFILNIFGDVIIRAYYVLKINAPTYN